MSIGSASTTYSFDDALTTANLLHLDQYNSATGGNIRTSWTYLSNGNVQSTTDPNGNVTQITFGCNNVYPSTVAVAAMLQTSYSYDCASGFLSNVTDSDNSITTSYTYDNIGRKTRVEQKKTGGGLDRVTDVTYDDANLVVTTTQDDTSASRLTNTTVFDPLGRVRSTVDGLGRKVEKAYRYGAGGTSYELTSNPYTSTSDSTMGWTLTTRTLSTPSSATPTAVTVTAYAGSALPEVWVGPARIRIPRELLPPPPTSLSPAAAGLPRAPPTRRGTFATAA